MVHDKIDGQLTLTHVLVPVSLMAFTMMLLFAFQGTQILRDRDALHEARGQQEKAFADSQRVQEQVKALVLGTQQLTEHGNKNAKVIMDKLKELGVVRDQAQKAPEASPAPVPAAEEKAAPGPVKP